MICEECLEPSTEPVDGSRLELCSRCVSVMGGFLLGTPPIRPSRWLEGKHYRVVDGTHLCMFCPSSFARVQGVRRHLRDHHPDQEPT